MTQSGTQAASPERILQTGLGFWASKTLLSAVELELFTKLAGAPSSAEQLRMRLGLHARSARDFFDALVALGFLQRNGDTYSNTADSDLFLDKRKPSYVGGILEMANARLFGFWNRLTDGLRTGEPQNEAKGGGPPPSAAGGGLPPGGAAERGEGRRRIAVRRGVRRPRAAAFVSRRDVGDQPRFEH